MTALYTILIVVFICATGIGSVLVVRAVKDQSRITTKRRQEMLDSLKTSIDVKKEYEQVKVNAAEYKKRLKLIAERHVDSDDVPGYCAADDLPFPCPTADLANLRKNPEKVK